MARDGLGNFTLSEPPFVYDTTILEDVMNNVLSDIASGLTQSLSRDGQSLPTAPLPMGGYRHTDVGNASARNQYAAAAQVQDGTFTWCGTAGGTANALTLSPSPSIPAYAAGQQFLFSAPATNTGAVTIAVSGLSAKPIQNAGAALVSGDIVAGRAYSIVYTGSAFQIAAHSLVAPVPVATESVSGISRQATIAEAKSGTSTTPAALPHVTPEGVAAALDPVNENISVLDGRTEILETVGPPKLSTASGLAPSYSARAAVSFNGITGELNSAKNVSSVTVQATGTYAVNFATALPNADYCWVASLASAQLDSAFWAGRAGFDAKTNSTIVLRCRYANVGGSNYVNAAETCVAVF